MCLHVDLVLQPTKLNSIEANKYKRKEANWVALIAFLC